MKSLADRIKKGARNVTIFGAVALGLALGAGKAKAQEQTENYKDFLNPFFKENLYNKTNYRGDGDGTKDGIVNYEDLALMQKGSQDISLDVDWDGVSSTSADQKILNDLLTGKIEYLPTDIRRAKTVAEREWALERFRQLGDAWIWDERKKDWKDDCDYYARYAFAQTNSVDEFENAPWFSNPAFSQFDMNRINEEFGNLHFYICYSQRKDGGYHTGLAYFVGSDDPAKDTPLSATGEALDVWRFLNTSNGKWLNPGDNLMDENGEVSIRSYIYTFKPISQQYGHGETQLLKINLTNGKGSVFNPIEGIITTRPSSGIEDRLTNFSNADIIGNVYPNPYTAGNGEIIIPYYGNGLEANVLVTDILGRTVYNEKYQSTATTNEEIKISPEYMAHWAAGRYNLSVTNKKGRETSTLTIVK
ncbi:MAG: T9SS type A sorting domain-containing protein [Bacteroidota bacterium]